MPPRDLDDRPARPARKKIPRRAKILTPAEGNGTVAEIFPNQSSVQLDGVAQRTLCLYRMSTLAFGGAQRERSPVCVGDRVRVEAGVIVGRCERRNRLVRPAPNARDPLLHVLAANLDFLVIVASAREPEFTPGIIDRFLVAASAQKIETVLCVNKTDLLGSGQDKPWSHYPDAGVRVVEASAQEGRGIEDLARQLLGKAAVFCGHSGVGKTTLLRRLLKDDTYGRVGSLSAASGKGRHTTTGAVLLNGPGGSAWIDTPGIMNFGLIDVKAEELLIHFPELYKAAEGCVQDCSHGVEPECALRKLPRHESYRQIHAALRGRHV